MFAHNAGGLNLRDRPHDLYCSTGIFYCGGAGGDPENYWFTVAAYNAAGFSAGYQVPGQSANSYDQPTLPLQTDLGAPSASAFSLNGGAPYT